MQVFNDLTRKKELLVPQVEGEYKIYVCGPTVYDYFHLGNARPFVVYDTLRRYLEYRGNKVTYVQNFTDIDDKIITRANQENIPMSELTERMIVEYYRDADGLNIKRATVNPKATECIPEIVSMIQTLVDKGHAYITGDGVYFDVATFPEYGKLAHLQLEDLLEGAGERSENRSEGRDINEKHNPMDFVLWKFKKSGEPAWPAPWGEGRPGWHIECSAMNKKYLGDTIDIHGGGQDLIFPHHENEIAQSEAANGKPFVRYWLHNGFINVNNEKMAKSVGNFFRVRDLSERYPYAVIRFLILQAHYRMPINFSDDLLESARNGWERICTCVKNLEFLLGAQSELASEGGNGDLAATAAIEAGRTQFNEALDDDLNTPDATAAIFELVRAINSLAAEHSLSRQGLETAKKAIVELCDVLGLNPLAGGADEIPAEVQELVALRTVAKKERNFAEADRLRAELGALGFKVEDTAQGPKVSRIDG